MSFLNLFTDDHSPGGKVALEGKKSIKKNPDVHELLQLFATAITFGTIQSRRHSEIHGFPTICVHLGVSYFLLTKFLWEK